MANERDTERMASELLGALMGSLTKPMLGTGRPQSQPQVDQGSMLTTIKEFLNQSLPGTKPRPQAGAPAPAQSVAPVAAATTPVEWEGMYRRHVREREAMHARHAREREDVMGRHVQEMEAAMGLRREVPKEEPKPVVRPAVAPQAPRPTGMAAQIVPGKSIGLWSVMTENGPKAIVAVSEAQAFREARRHGLSPTAAQLTGIHAYTQQELEEEYRTLGVPGKRDSMVGEFERAIKLGLIPDDAEFVRLENREWGYRVGSGRVLYRASELFEKLRR